MSRSTKGLKEHLKNSSVNSIDEKEAEEGFANFDLGGGGADAELSEQVLPLSSGFVAL